MFAQIENLRIHYRIFGKGPILLFLHGWGANSNHYQKLIDYFASNFKVVTVDLPGCGLSGTPDRVWSSFDYVDLINRFAQQIGLKGKITVVGHSLGGKIAFLIAAKKLLDVDKLVLISSAGIRARRTLKMHGKVYIYKVLKNLAKLPVLKLFLAKYIKRMQNRAGSADYRNAKGVMRATLVKLVNEDLRDFLPKVSVPTLLLWGNKDDSTTLESGQLMASLIPNSKLVVVDGAGHFPHLDDLSKCTTALGTFLF